MTPLRERADLVRRAEAAGYTDLWSGETNGPDGFTPLALAAAWTESMRLGTGVVGVLQPGPGAAGPQAAALPDASGAFALGIGASVGPDRRGLERDRLRPLAFEGRRDAGVPAAWARCEADRRTI